MNKKIAVFGGASCTDEAYYFPIAYTTGQLLAQAGYVTITGAGPGMMEEALRGAHEAGGLTVGVSLNIKERKPSSYIHEEYVFDTLNPRQDKLISIADAYLAVPGGVGTLYEILAILALKRLHEIPQDKPLILIDNYYQDLESLLSTVVREGFVEGSLSGLYTLVHTPDEALSMINAYFHHS